MRVLVTFLMLMGMPANADVIRWGDTGSIFGGTTWQAAPDDRLVVTAYGDDAAAYAERAEWVWTDQSMRVGKITFLIEGSFARATAIVLAAGDPGAAPDFEGDCMDAGFRTVAVDIPQLAYETQVDNCIAGSPRATGVVKRHYLRVRRVQDALFVGLGLGRLVP